MKLTDKELENRLARAVENETPNVLPKILLRIQQKKGQEKYMETSTPTQKPKGAKIVKWAAAVAALLVVAIGITMVSMFYKTDSLVYFDANPGIELRVNSSGKVLGAQPLNDEANLILDGMNLQNVDLNVAVNALIGSMVNHGYITETQNAVLVSVVSPNLEKGAALQTKVVDEVSGVLTSSSVHGAILGQTLVEDARLRELATQYNISVGKAALVDALVSQEPLLNFADIAALPISDIYLLISSKNANLEGVAQTGQASAGAYLPQEEAKAIALAHAGVQESDVLGYEIEFDYDDGRMVYEIEFNTQGAKFEYEIDATNGSIVEFKRKDTGGASAGSSSSGSGSSGGNSAFIGEAQAKTIALAHAGLAEADVTFVKFVQYEKKGVELYDMIFLSATHKYTYHINAITGEIIAHYTHQRDYSESYPPANSTPSGSASSGTYIGEEQAKNIAFAHAGVSASNVYELKIKLDHDHNRMVYEVEFSCAGIEYEYEIDAYTGEIIKWESDHD